MIFVNVYQEITLLPSGENTCQFLWEKLFQQIHLALVSNKITKNVSRNGSEQTDDVSEYGLSFPLYDEQLNALGCKLRVFAESTEKLEKLDLFHWLEKFLDYCQCTSLLKVPQEIGHARFRRKQFVTNIERMARRRAKRKQESIEQALDYYKDVHLEVTKLPYIYVQSLSSKKLFPLFIEWELVEHEISGDFTCYGLSDTATVPWF